MCRRRPTSYLYQLTVATLCPMSEQHKTSSWILLTQNKIAGTFSAIRERAQEDKKRQTINATLRMRKQKESAEQLEQRSQARNNSLRLRRQQESAEPDRQRRQIQGLAHTDFHWRHCLLNSSIELNQQCPLQHQK